MAEGRYETDSCYIYVPSNVSDNCNVVVYYPGAGGAHNSSYYYGDYSMDNYIATDPGKIVVVNKDWNTDSSNVIKGLSDVQNDYHINVGDINIFSASRGDHSVFTAAQNFNNNGFHTSNIAILDTSFLLSPDDKGTARGITIDHNLATNLANNGTSVLIASQYDKQYLDEGNMNQLISAGVPITHIHVEVPQDNCNINSTAHRKIKEEFIKNGIMDLLSGDKTSMDDNWTYSFDISRYDYDINAWVDGLSLKEFDDLFSRLSSFDTLDEKFNNLKGIELYDIKTLPSLLGYSDGSVTSEVEYAVGEMNNLRGIVGKTQFLGSLSSGLSGLSAGNPVLERESSLISAYFNATGNLLNKVSLLSDGIINVAFLIDQLDGNLSQDADGLNGVTNLSYNGSQSSSAKTLNNGYNLNVGKYSDNKASGFELRLSNRVYTLGDFDSSYAKAKWGYDQKLAREAFIGVCIAECDKTPDGMLSIATVALNRCESDNWSNAYTKTDNYGTTDGTKPFDQMFVNNGRQYSVITSGTYKNYMPSLAGKDNINEYLAKYGTSYEELEAAADDALQGGVRNSYYTGFRANTPQYSGEKLDPSRGFCNVFRYENYNRDYPEAQNARAQLVSMSLKGTSYSGKDTILAPSNYSASVHVVNSATTTSSSTTKPILTFQSKSPVANDLQNMNTSTSTGTSSTSSTKQTPNVINYTSSGTSSYRSSYTSYSQSSSQSTPVNSVSEEVSVNVTPPTDSVTVSETVETAPITPTVTPVSNISVSNSQPVKPTVVISPQQSTNTTSVASSDVSTLTTDESAPLNSVQSNELEQAAIDAITKPFEKEEALITPNAIIKPYDEIVEDNSDAKNIGLAVASIAAASGLAYAGSKAVKKYKENQSLDDKQSKDRSGK